MGVSTDGKICFGILFDEGFEFPWDNEDYDGIEEWWLSVNNYKQPFDLYDEHGEYIIIDGKEPPKDRIDEHYAHRREFFKKHPLPVEKVDYCSDGCPMYIIAIPKTVMRAHRGYPVAFKPEDLVVSDDVVKALCDFCKEHNIEYKDQPQWYLCSYWG